MNNNTLEGINSKITGRKSDKWHGGQNGGNHCHRTEYWKKNEKNEDNPRDLWDSIQCSNSCIIGVPEEERKEGPKKIIEEIIAENVPNMKKGTVS